MQVYTRQNATYRDDQLNTVAEVSVKISLLRGATRVYLRISLSKKCKNTVEKIPVTLTSVAFMRPARVCPTRIDSSSVANASNW